ncbi:hypothetical protein [Nonomuraea roseola]|uniref:Secreted protein n=1 Tax=Nonomuraea roseola TaxID=46179 RepID=A0ABV5Q255_9ACTN
MKKMIGWIVVGIAVCGASLTGASSALAAADFSDVIVCIRTTAEFSDGTLGTYCSNG